MLKKIELTNVGPIKNKKIDFANRLNIITGDNGLGKSFLLDIIWYVLTRRWPAQVNPRLTSGYMARPGNPSQRAQIILDLNTEKGKKLEDYTVSFDREKQTWIGKAGRPYSSGLVIYALADGSFSVWDPAKNYWKKTGNVDIQERQPAFVFSPTEVWEGLKSQEGKTLCNGLLRDWAMWQTNQKGWEFSVLETMLDRLSPPEFKLKPGNLTRIGIEDVSDVPTIKMPYGEVPVLWASAGYRRVLAFAYFLTWTLSEHIKACRVLGKTPTPQVTFLLDEVEAHLHPKWQRQIMKGVIDVLDKIPQVFSSKNIKNNPVSGASEWGAHKKNKIQIFALTHSALVMSSLETHFDSTQDKWFDFDTTENGNVDFTARNFVKKGDVKAWLTDKDAFGLSTTMPIEAEKAIQEYNKKAAGLSKDQKKKLIKKLENVLPDTDPFWAIVDFEKMREPEK